MPFNGRRNPYGRRPYRGREYNFRRGSVRRNNEHGQSSSTCASQNKVNSQSISFSSTCSSFPTLHKQKIITSTDPSDSGPYIGWNLYMAEDYSTKSPMLPLLEIFHKFLIDHNVPSQKSEIEEKHSFRVSIKELFEDEAVRSAIPDLEEVTINTPERIISCCGLAMHQLLTKRMKIKLREEAREVLMAENKELNAVDEDVIDAAVPDVSLAIINARLVDFPKLTCFKNLKASYYGKLVSIKGTVVRVGTVKPLCTMLAFTCAGCDRVHALEQPEGRYSTLASCPFHKCQSRMFMPNRSHKLTQTIDWQTIKLQEVAEDDQGEYGRIPRSIECVLTRDLVDSCIPGDLVTLSGIVKVSQSEEGSINRGDKCVFTLYIDACSVVNCKAGKDLSSAAGIEFNMQDYYAIQALLETMEQQSISVAKSSIVCSLPARTSVLAAANPAGGHYDKTKTVSENLKMNSALLSRFDLVFILVDKPDEELDSLLSDHIMSLHSGSSKENDPFKTFIRKEDLLNSSCLSEDAPLCQRLKLQKDEEIELIPHSLMRKYICYARKYVRAHITPSAAKLLQQFYLELREKYQNTESTPITTRQLESLIRLTEARAHCELREEATESDARDVIEIMKYSMIDTFSNERGLLDFRRSQHGSGMSSRKKVMKFVSALQRLSLSACKSVFTVDEMQGLASQLSLQVDSFTDFLSSVNHQGYLLKKGPKLYELLTVS